VLVWKEVTLMMKTGIVAQGCWAFAVQLHVCHTSLKEEKHGLAYQSLGREGHLLLVMVDLNMKLIFTCCIKFFHEFWSKKIVSFAPGKATCTAVG
jgi:hypothetical protein